MAKLQELAATIRSKNASPFVTTLDIFFEDEEGYRWVRESGILTARTVSSLYRIPENDVLGVWFVDLCKGIKISFLKPRASDDLTSGDLYGAQQNAPLLDIEVPPLS